MFCRVFSVCYVIVYLGLFSEPDVFSCRTRHFRLLNQTFLVVETNVLVVQPDRLSCQTNRWTTRTDTKFLGSFLSTSITHGYWMEAKDGQGKPKDQPILTFWGMFFLDVLYTSRRYKVGDKWVWFFDVFCLCIVRQIPVAGCCIK